MPLNIPLPKDLLPEQIFYGYHEGNDVVLVEVSGFYSALKSVEWFLNPQISKPGAVDIYGFPGNSNFVGDGLFYYKNATNIHLGGEDLHIESDINSKTSIRDIEKYFIRSRDYSFEKKQLKGFSGSPVFIKDANSGRYWLGGVLTGTGIRDNVSSLIFVSSLEYTLHKIFSRS